MKNGAENGREDVEGLKLSKNDSNSSNPLGSLPSSEDKKSAQGNNEHDIPLLTDE